MKSASRVLFVCTGNTCRSPMAKAIADHWAAHEKISWSTDSAGVSAIPGMPMAAQAIATLAARGISTPRHSSHLLTMQSINEFKVIYTMTEAHRRLILEKFHVHSDRVQVLRAAAGLKPLDIADPIGGSDTDYENCADAIEESIRAILANEAHAKESA